jgi:hypothetical protein
MECNPSSGGTARATIPAKKEDAAMTRIAKLSTVLLTFFLLISLGLLGSVALADKYVTVYEDGRHGHYRHHPPRGHGRGHRNHDCDEYVVVQHYAPRPYPAPYPPAYYPPTYYAPRPSSGIHVSGGIFFNDVIR